jgi:hypothetical protein
MVFHVILPGKPVISVDGFQQMDTNRWVLPIEDCQAINEVVVFLSGALVPELGLAVYIAAPPFEVSQWHYLGCVRNDLPSALFKPRYVWSERDAIPTAAQIGVELLPLATLSMRVPEMASNEVVEVAKLIAADLVNYITSFDGRLPSDGMDRWLRRFVDRCRRQGINWLQPRD